MARLFYDDGGAVEILGRRSHHAVSIPMATQRPPRVLGVVDYARENILAAYPCNVHLIRLSMDQTLLPWHLHLSSTKNRCRWMLLALLGKFPIIFK